MDRRGGYYEPRGPSPWVPATILGIIILIATTPYRRQPDPAAIAYQTAVRPASSFPLPWLWIPVIAIIAIQFFGGHRVYTYDRYGRPVTRAHPYAASGGPVGYGVGSGYSTRAFGPDRMAPGYNRGGGGWGGGWPWSRGNSYRYNPAERGLGSLFMDYGGHWMLILIGLAVFTLVGSSSAHPHAAAAMAPQRLGFPWTLGFPWSLFAPRRQIVIPLL